MSKLRHILGRKWCVGEVATAKLHKVHSAVVRWPNFTDPSATTHEDLSFASPFLVKEDLELSGEGAPSSRQERGFVPDLL
eukprot:s1162_g17.t1